MATLASVWLWQKLVESSQWPTATILLPAHESTEISNTHWHIWPNVALTIWSQACCMEWSKKSNSRSRFANSTTKHQLLVATNSLVPLSPALGWQRHLARSLAIVKRQCLLRACSCAGNHVYCDIDWSTRFARQQYNTNRFGQFSPDQSGEIYIELGARGCVKYLSRTTTHNKCHWLPRH